MRFFFVISWPSVFFSFDRFVADVLLVLYGFQLNRPLEADQLLICFLIFLPALRNERVLCEKPHVHRSSGLLIVHQSIRENGHFFSFPRRFSNHFSMPPVKQLISVSSFLFPPIQRGTKDERFVKKNCIN